MVDRERVLAWGPGCAVRNVAKRYLGGSSGESISAPPFQVFRVIRAAQLYVFDFIADEAQQATGVESPIE